jgi:hypothetical protein
MPVCPSVRRVVPCSFLSRVRSLSSHFLPFPLSKYMDVYVCIDTPVIIVSSHLRQFPLHPLYFTFKSLLIFTVSHSIPFLLPPLLSLPPLSSLPPSLLSLPLSLKYSSIHLLVRIMFNTQTRQHILKKFQSKFWVHLHSTG